MSTPVIQANIELHTALAQSYEASEPHFRPENKRRVKAKLRELSARAGSGSLLDLGCGTGFMLALASDLFDEVHGVDVTPAMLAQVDLSSGKVTLTQCPAETTSYPDGRFNVVTAYSFLHHTADYTAVMREALRVLKPGGIFYAAQDPNRLFWQALKNIDANTVAPESLAAKARRAALDVDDVLESDFGTPRALVQAAEPLRAHHGGLDPARAKQDALECGFASCEVRLEWMLGQADLMHGSAAAHCSAIEAYLRAATPLGDHLFKYVELVMEK